MQEIIRFPLSKSGYKVFMVMFTVDYRVFFFSYITCVLFLANVFKHCDDEYMCSLSMHKYGSP